MVYNNHVGNDWWYYFEAGEREKAINEIEAGIKIFPRDNVEKNVEFLNKIYNLMR